MWCRTPTNPLLARGGLRVEPEETMHARPMWLLCKLGKLGAREKSRKTPAPLFLANMCSPTLSCPVRTKGLTATTGCTCELRNLNDPRPQLDVLLHTEAAPPLIPSLLDRILGKTDGNMPARAPRSEMCPNKRVGGRVFVTLLARSTSREKVVPQSGLAQIGLHSRITL